jgi:hypothetical protein
MKYPALPKKKRQFICTKCGSNECKGSIEIAHPLCSSCGYHGFSVELLHSDEDLKAYANQLVNYKLFKFSLLLIVNVALAAAASVFVTLVLK